MAAEEVSAKGIILSAAPQGEYGRRLVVLTDLYGKITVFASGAAKASSHLIGLVRPMTCAVFRLQRGRSAWNLHGAELIEAFDGLQRSYDATLYGLYLLELAAYEAQEGMTEAEARELLNLMYVSLMALQRTAGAETAPVRAASGQAAGLAASGALQQSGRQHADGKSQLLSAPAALSLSYPLIRRVFELRMLKLAGEYTSAPLEEAGEETAALWRLVLALPLSKLYQETARFLQKLTAASGQDAGETERRFCRETKRLFARQVPCQFRAEKLLME